MADESADIINKPEFLEASDGGCSKHISLLNNIVDEDKLSIIMEIDFSFLSTLGYSV